RTEVDEASLGKRWKHISTAIFNEGSWMVKSLGLLLDHGCLFTCHTAACDGRIQWYQPTSLVGIE
ncbi:hypothetical protein ACPV51_24370, partial [Vibrio astriarenae]